MVTLTGIDGSSDRAGSDHNPIIPNLSENSKIKNSFFEIKPELSSEAISKSAATSKITQVVTVARRPLTLLSHSSRPWIDC